MARRIAADFAGYIVSDGEKYQYAIAYLCPKVTPDESSRWL